MPRLPAFDPIMYLVARKFPVFRQKRTDETIAGRRWPEPGSTLLGLGAGEAYRQELLKLPKEEIDALVEQEREAERREAAEQAEREEEKRFFNDPRAAADLDYWSRAAYWHIDEGIALSLGKDPRMVRWETLQPILDRSKFARDYAERRELALRAEAAGLIAVRTAPGVYLAWAARTGFDFPSALIDAVTERGVQIADWKSLFDEAKAEIEALVEERGELKEELEAATAEKANKDTAKPLLTRERASALKLILGMAMVGYGYDPSAKRSDTAREIAGDLALKGLNLDEDTIRKWLREAREHFPRDGQTGETE